MCGIHRGVEERRSCVVPEGHELAMGLIVGIRLRNVFCVGGILTNLMATCWLLRRFVPSKITPKEPSPIFLPTR